MWYIFYFRGVATCDRTLPPELATLYNFFNLFWLLLDIKLVITVNYTNWLINLEAETQSGVVNSDVGSGRSIAMETLLLGLKSCVADCTGGLMAMDTLLIDLAERSVFVVI